VTLILSHWRVYNRTEESVKGLEAILQKKIVAHPGGEQLKKTMKRGLGHGKKNTETAIIYIPTGIYIIAPRPPEAQETTG